MTSMVVLPNGPSIGLCFKGSPPCVSGITNDSPLLDRNDGVGGKQQQPRIRLGMYVHALVARKFDVVYTSIPTAVELGRLLHQHVKDVRVLILHDSINVLMHRDMTTTITIPPIMPSSSPDAAPPTTSLSQSLGVVFTSTIGGTKARRFPRIAQIHANSQLEQMTRTVSPLEGMYIHAVGISASNPSSMSNMCTSIQYTAPASAEMMKQILRYKLEREDTLGVDDFDDTSTLLSTGPPSPYHNNNSSSRKSFHMSQRSGPGSTRSVNSFGLNATPQAPPSGGGGVYRKLVLSHFPLDAPPPPSNTHYLYLHQHNIQQKQKMQQQPTLKCTLSADITDLRVKLNHEKRIIWISPHLDPQGNPITPLPLDILNASVSDRDGDNNKSPCQDWRISSLYIPPGNGIASLVDEEEDNDNDKDAKSNNNNGSNPAESGTRFSVRELERCLKKSQNIAGRILTLVQDFGITVNNNNKKMVSRNDDGALAGVVEEQEEEIEVLPTSENGRMTLAAFFSYQTGIKDNKSMVKDAQYPSPSLIGANVYKPQPHTYRLGRDMETLKPSIIYGLTLSFFMRTGLPGFSSMEDAYHFDDPHGRPIGSNGSLRFVDRWLGRRHVSSKSSSNSTTQEVGEMVLQDGQEKLCVLLEKHGSISVSSNASVLAPSISSATIGAASSHSTGSFDTVGSGKTRKNLRSSLASRTTTNNMQQRHWVEIQAFHPRYRGDKAIPNSPVAARYTVDEKAKRKAYYWARILNTSWKDQIDVYEIQVWYQQAWVSRYYIHSLELNPHHFVLVQPPLIEDNSISTKNGLKGGQSSYSSTMKSTQESTLTRQTSTIESSNSFNGNTILASMYRREYKDGTNRRKWAVSVAPGMDPCFVMCLTASMDKLIV